MCDRPRRLATECGLGSQQSDYLNSRSDLCERPRPKDSHPPVVTSCRTCLDSHLQMLARTCTNQVSDKDLEACLPEHDKNKHRSGAASGRSGRQPCGACRAARPDERGSNRAARALSWRSFPRARQGNHRPPLLSCIVYRPYDDKPSRKSTTSNDE